MTTTPSALPFVIRRGDQVMTESEITTTRETIHGLFRLDGRTLVVEWRLARSTGRVGMTIRTDREVEAVRSARIPLASLAGARVRWAWWPWPPGHRFVLTAADLSAFEEIVGRGGLELDHPAELGVQIRRADREAAREFASELELALADHALRAAEGEKRLPAPDDAPTE